MLYIGRGEPGNHCSRRQAIAQQILRTRDDALHGTVLKLKEMFPASLAVVAAGDDVPASLFVCLRLIVFWYWGDSQEMEGVNSLLKMAVSRSPTISLPLLCARVALRKDIAFASGMGKVTKHSVLARISVGMLADAGYHIDADIAVQGQEKRYTPPGKGAFHLGDMHKTRSLGAQRATTQPLEWARSYALEWYRRRSCLDAQGFTGLVFEAAGHDTTDVWLCPFTYNRRGFFMKFTRTRCGMLLDRDAQYTAPLEGIDLFLQQYDAACQHPLQVHMLSYDADSSHWGALETAALEDDQHIASLVAGGLWVGQVRMLDASEELFLLSKSPLTASRAPRRDRPLIDAPAPEEALTAPATVEDLLRLHDGGADATDDPTGIWTTLDAMDVTKSAVAMSDPAWQKGC